MKNISKKCLCWMVSLSLIFILVGPINVYADNYGVAYWSFNETDGSVVEDSWGNNDGTNTGGSWEVGKVNNSIRFQGDDYVDINQSDIATSWTAAVWVKYDNVVSHTGVILSSANAAIKAEQYNNTNRVGYTKYGAADYTFDYSLPNNEWTHLTFVGDTTGVKLYVNGQYRDSRNIAISCPMSRIGKGAYGGGLIGSLDELKIYSKALTAEEIYELAGILPEELLSRASRQFIDKGLQIQAWVATTESGLYEIDPENWDAINFTAPTYYRAPMYHTNFHAARPNSQWSLAKAPFADHLSGPPYNNDHFLSQQQRDNLDNLVSMCFGDEEYYSTSLVSNLKAWFDLSRELYPDVLVHNNQWTGQWTEANLRYYISQAKPDILTFDHYVFDEPVTQGYTFMRQFANNIRVYRKLALEGYDGTGNSPIAFGQYLLGYLTGQTSPVGGEYLISQSQINLVPFITLTMGGKWLNYFIWGKNNKRYCLLFDADGEKRDQFYYYANMAEEARNLGDHLVRLNSTDVYMVRGKHMVNGYASINPLPADVSTWYSSVDEYITNITVDNIGQVNDNLAGDVMIGYFEQLQGLTDEMKSLFTSDDPKYFMILNGLVNDDGIDTPELDMGSCDDSKQRITLTLDLGNRPSDSLKRVSRQTGQIEDVSLTHVSGTTYTLVLELGGGKADLFFWE